MESLDSQTTRTLVAARMVECQGRIMRELPPGVRFVPNDQELVEYLTRKVNLEDYQFQLIEEISADDFIMKPPQALVAFTLPTNDREWFFFIHGDQDLIPCEKKAIIMVGNGMGSWRCYFGEYPIYNEDEDERVIGYKIDFIYFKGEVSQSKKTHWKMNLYRLPTECHNPAQERKWTVGKIVRGTSYDDN